MQQKVAKFVKRHQQLQRNSTCLVGVSGGPDSMALLHFLHEISAEYNLRIIAVAIDHLLRGAESARDIEYVREVCEMWGIEFVSVRVDVAAYKREHKVGTQVAARTLRYEVYKEQAAHYKADYIALGHHGDDQIETIIMGVTRATNLQTVSGIPAKRPFFGAEIIRPFLCVTKREILDYCAQHDIHPRIDPSNLETAYTRNDIRANVVPLLKGRNHNLHRTMQSLSESLQEDEAFILKMASDYVEKHVILRDNPRTVTFSLKSFYQCPLSLQRRVYRLVLSYLYDELPKQFTYVHEQLFLEIFQEEGTNKVIDFPNGLKVERAYNQARLYFQTDRNIEPFLGKLQSVPSSIRLPDGHVLTLTYTDKDKCDRADTYIFSEDQVRFPLHIRNRKPGDRMSWEGLQGSKKIKDIFIDEKVPQDERDKMYIVTDDMGVIMWLIGMKKGKLADSKGAGPYIMLTYKSTS